MNLGLRCGQMMAERYKEMNIIERSAFWYRYERNSQALCNQPTSDDRFDELEKLIREQPEFVGKQWDIVNQLRLDQQNLRKTLYDTLKKKDNVSRKNIYTISTI